MKRALHALFRRNRRPLLALPSATPIFDAVMRDFGWTTL